MAIVSLLAGGMVGFFSALVSLIMLNASWIAALGIWSGIGTVVALVVLGLALAPKRAACGRYRPQGKVLS